MLNLAQQKTRGALERNCRLGTNESGVIFKLHKVCSVQSLRGDCEEDLQLGSSNEPED